MHSMESAPRTPPRLTEFKKMTRTAAQVFAALLIALAFAADALAYIDPGTGSMVFQLVIAGVLGALFTIKLWINGVKNFFLGLFGKKPKDGEGN